MLIEVPASESEILRLTPNVRHVTMLRDAGWGFVHRRNDAGELVGIDCYRRWAGRYVDGIVIKSDTDAAAMRMIATDPPDPPNLIWDKSGSLAEVVTAVLSLPAPSSQTTPLLVVAAPLSLPSTFVGGAW